MIGLDASTGKQLSGMAHLRQSVRDILTTPIGTRVMRRDYGSRLYRLVDATMNDAMRAF
jgi:phage baseplate assembly protein W